MRFGYRRAATGAAVQGICSRTALTLTQDLPL
jgi:hypothetical protein